MDCDVDGASAAGRRCVSGIVRTEATVSLRIVDVVARVERVRKVEAAARFSDGLSRLEAAMRRIVDAAAADRRCVGEVEADETAGCAMRLSVEECSGIIIGSFIILIISIKKLIITYQMVQKLQTGDAAAF